MSEIKEKLNAMERVMYKSTDWIFFFNKKNVENIGKILNYEKNKETIEELVTWKLLTVILPLITFLVVLILNIITNIKTPHLFYSFINNGSLPIISFGIITSGMPYLLEQLRDFPEFHAIRRRVMTIAIFFLFLSSSIYILQTLHIINKELSCFTNLFLLISSVYVFLTSKSIGVKMFLLQSKNIQTYEENVNDTVKNLKGAIDEDM
jgi:hypothetical protein